MSTKTLHQRLEQQFGYAGRMHLPKTVPDTLRARLLQHAAWLQSGGRFGARLVLEPRPGARTFRYEQMEMDGYNFRKAKLVNIVFSWCNLRIASFAGAELINVFFENCDVEETDYTDGLLHDVEFANCVDHDKAIFRNVRYISGKIPPPDTPDPS